MNEIRRLIRSNRCVYDFVRSTIMFIKRIWYGLHRVDKTFYMRGNSFIHRDFVAGPYSFVNYGCHIGPRVELGSYAMLGPRVAIVGGDHVTHLAGTPMIFAGRPTLLPTVIGADAWVGYGAVVMAGVTIGRGAIVAAHAVVTKDVPPYEIHAGVPAHKIADRFESADDIARHDRMLNLKPFRGEYAPPLA